MNVNVGSLIRQERQRQGLSLRELRPAGRRLGQHAVPGREHDPCDRFVLGRRLSSHVTRVAMSGERSARILHCGAPHLDARDDAPRDLG